MPGNVGAIINARTPITRVVLYITFDVVSVAPYRSAMFFATNSYEAYSLAYSLYFGIWGLTNKSVYGAISKISRDTQG